MRNVFDILKIYNKRYYLTHPWVFVADFFRAIRLGWQRATRGYSDTDTYSIDFFLIEMLPELFTQYRDNLHGYPCTFTENEWDEYLTKNIIEPLKFVREVYREDSFRDEEKNKKAQEKLELAFHSIAKEYFSLWD